MAFMDLFRPSWRHSDPSVRRLAVRRRWWTGRLNMVKLLAIATDDPDPRVRMTAAAMLDYGTDDISRLPEIAAGIDQTVLADLAENDDDPLTRLAAANTLTDRDRADAVYVRLMVMPGSRPPRVVFARDAERDALSHWRRTVLRHWLTAMQKFRSEALLVSLCTTYWDPEVARAVVDRITDQSVLAKIAKSPRALVEALERVTEQTLLLDIVKNGSHGPICQQAANRISDHAVPAAIARSEPPRYRPGDSRSAPVVNLSRIADRALLEDLARNARLAEVRIGAVSQLTDIGLLLDIAVGAGYGNVREHTLKRIARIEAPEAYPNRQQAIAALLALSVTSGVACALSALGWEPDSKAECLSYFSALGWPEGTCLECGDEEHWHDEQVPGHDAGDYHGGMGEAVSIERRVDDECPWSKDPRLRPELLERYRESVRRARGPGEHRR